MIRVLHRYWVFLMLVFVNLLLVLVIPEVGLKSISISVDNLQEVLFTLPPIFVLLGLLDVWVPRETMIRLMGEGSGLKGITMAFLLGSVAAGPLYAAFPIAGVLLKKESKLSNVVIFIGAWSTTKIPLLMFEASAMGWNFMLARFLIDIPGIVLIAYIAEKVLTCEERKIIYENAQMLD